MKLRYLLPIAIIAASTAMLQTRQGQALLQQAGLPGNPLSSQQTTVYRWQDSQGQWHFGDQPPQKVAASRITLPKVNTLPAERAENDESTLLAQSDNSSITSPSAARELANSYLQRLPQVDTHGGGRR